MLQYSYGNEEYFVSFFGDLFKKNKTDAIYEIKSPNGRVVVTFILDRGQISYFVKKDERLVLRQSRLGIALKDSSPLADGFSVVRAHPRDEPAGIDRPSGCHRHDAPRGGYSHASV